MRRQGLRLSSAFAVVARELLHRSPILMTPYADAQHIDTAALGAFITESYAAAGLSPEDVDTGALIVTGNAALKENAEAIARLIAADAGRFVCATAGPHLEAQLAAHGSGAVERSRAGQTVLNLDVGGGTTKLTVAIDGRIRETAALAVGARVVALDANGRVTRLEHGALAAARAAGVHLSLGAQLDDEDLGGLARTLAEAVTSVVSARRFEGLARELLVTEAIELPDRIDSLQLSGGVAEYFHGREDRDLGDLGRRLGSELRARLAEPGLPPVAPSAEGIRATVIGAGQYTLQISGSTIFLSHPDLLPIADLRVVRPALDGIDAASVARGIARSLERDRGDGGDGRVALALQGSSEPTYARLRELAVGIAGGSLSLPPGRPLVLLFDRDIARSVGAILREELIPKRRIIALDELRVGDLDYVDLGRALHQGTAVPVVVKSLVFSPLAVGGP